MHKGSQIDKNIESKSAKMLGRAASIFLNATRIQEEVTPVGCPHMLQACSETNPQNVKSCPVGHPVALQQPIPATHTCRRIVNARVLPAPGH